MKLARTVLPVCLLAALSGALLAHPVAASGASARFCAGSVATIVGTPGRDVMHGTRHRDVIVALGGDDVIHGGGGDDVICGGPGDDRIWGDAGRDIIQGGTGNDVARGGAGNDAVEGMGGRDRLYGGPGRDLIDRLRKGVGHGGPGADRLEFYGGTNRVYGDGGADLFYGSFRMGASQVVDGGSGKNALVAEVPPRSGGSDAPWDHVTIDLGRGVVVADGERARFHGSFRSVRVEKERSALTWTLLGTRGDDHLATLGTAPYPVVERGRAGDDELVSGRGDDLLDGGPGQDRASAGAGDNTCVSIEAAVGSDPGCDLS